MSFAAAGGRSAAAAEASLAAAAGALSGLPPDPVGVGSAAAPAPLLPPLLSATLTVPSFVIAVTQPLTSSEPSGA